jgi:hypothetical protein
VAIPIYLLPLAEKTTMAATMRRYHAAPGATISQGKTIGTARAMFESVSTLPAFSRQNVRCAKAGLQKFWGILLCARCSWSARLLC